MKKTRGFSYIEVLIAMALFAIALLAIIPAMQQAGRNMIYAQEAYASQLQAQGLMLVVRDAIDDGENPRTQALQYAAGSFEFSFWVNNRWFHSKGNSAIDDPGISAVLDSMNATISNQASIIVVVVWDDENQISGRALGVM